MTKLIYERIIKSLTLFGLAQSDAEVYVHLATNGPQEARSIANALQMHKRQLYRSLRSLQSRGIIIVAEYPACFSAVSFEEALDALSKASLEEAKSVEKNKEKILSIWRLMITGNSTG